MGLTKAEAIEELDSSPSLSNQTALVKKILGPSTIKPTRHIIPGGATMHTSLDAAQLQGAVSTWLRHVRHFTRVTVGLCNDPEVVAAGQRQRVRQLDSDSRVPEWDRQGKSWLGMQIAAYVTEKGVLAVEVEKDGIYTITDKAETFEPGCDTWEPFIEFIPDRRARGDGR
jgi:hypothetical protein